jgi:hypothetical protein
MMPAAGPPMTLSQIPAQPQPATPTVQPTIAPTLLRGQNRPEVRSQLHQRRLRRSSNLYIQGASARAIWRISGLHHSGGGACGSVRYSLRGEPFRIGICHCADCRKESGSVLVVYGQWRRGDVGILGETRTRIAAAFARYVGPAPLKPIPTLSR